MITNCYNTGRISCRTSFQGELYFGGIMGGTTDSSIINCYNTGDIETDVPKACISGVSGRLYRYN